MNEGKSPFCANIYICIILYVKGSYLARKYHLNGKNEREMAEIDMYGNQITDMGKFFLYYFHFCNCKTP
jgi:hypothetical protein